MELGELGELGALGALGAAQAHGYLQTVPVFLILLTPLPSLSLSLPPKVLCPSLPLLLPGAVPVPWLHPAGASPAVWRLRVWLLAFLALLALWLCEYRKKENGMSVSVCLRVSVCLSALSH